MYDSEERFSDVKQEKERELTEDKRVNEQNVDDIPDSSLKLKNIDQIVTMEGISLQDQMDIDLGALGGVSEEMEDIAHEDSMTKKEEDQYSFIQSGKRKKKKVQKAAVAKRQSSRLIRDGVPVSLKAQKRVSEKNDISGKHKFSILNSVDVFVLSKIAVDSDINLGETVKVIVENINTLKASPIYHLLAKERMTKEEVERLPFSVEIEGCFSLEDHERVEESNKDVELIEERGDNNSVVIK